MSLMSLPGTWHPAQFEAGLTGFDGFHLLVRRPVSHKAHLISQKARYSQKAR